MKRISLLAMMAVSLTTTGCGGSGGAEVSSAPKTQLNAGIIASCTSKEQAQSLATEYDGQFRVINEKRKIMEIYGVSESQISKANPKAKLKSNIVYEGKLISGDFTAQSSVTNQQFFGSHVPTYRNSNSAKMFSHLQQIDGVDLTTKGEGVVIAVIDTGVYYNHPHLSPNIYTNPNDIHGDNGNSLDDDNNGKVDDYVGWDFYNGDAFPIDDNGHGSHVAGLAAGTLGGVAPQAKILPIKVLSADGRGDLGTITAGILYALDRDADIINLSLGGSAAGEITQQLQELIDSISLSHSKGALVIAAAGNGGNDGVGDCNDDTPMYPANIDSPNLIAVAAVDQENTLTSYSNFGGATVHIAAPGGSYYDGGLFSTGIPYCDGPCSDSDQTYVTSMGTSMATPLVAGLAALLKSKDSNLTNEQIKTIILENGKKVSQLNDLIKSESVINVAQAVDSI